jgi:hypothetical protein
MWPRSRNDAQWSPARVIRELRLETADLVCVELKEVGQVAGLRIDLQRRKDLLGVGGELAEEIEMHADHHDVDDCDWIGTNEESIHEEGPGCPQPDKAELEDRTLHQRNDHEH